MGKSRSGLGFEVKLADMDMPEVVLERTEIPGLEWVANDFALTGAHSRIVIASAGQMFTNIVWHAPADDFNYEVFGIHVGQDDRLTFINGKEIVGRFVDCRKGSPTYHKTVEMTFDGNPDRKLVISRGIAHWFGNLEGVVTRNEPMLYWAIGNDDFDPAIDTINVPREAAVQDFPSVTVNPWRIPNLLSQVILLSQRLRLRKGQKNYPFRFKAGSRTVVLVKNFQAERDAAGAAAAST
jgi:dTDP-4-dehydrorhamnose 3,5-epimerase